MYAIFRAKGMQFRAEPDTRLRIPSLDAEPGDEVRFEEVLLSEDRGKVRVGTPALPGASVSAEVIRHGRGEKIVVFKRKRRKGYRRKQGHRQDFTEVRIVGIDVPAAPAPKKAAPKAKAPKAPPEAEAAKEAPKAKAPKPAAEKRKPAPKAPTAAPEPAAAPDVDITDAARALAEAHGVDLAALEGSGKEGRILKSDVEKAIKAMKAAEDET